MRKKGVEIGSFWIWRDSSPEWTRVRRVVGFCDPSVVYRDYSAVDGKSQNYVSRGMLLPNSLKSWGQPITEEVARRIIPNMDELDTAKDIEERERINNITHMLTKEIDMAIFLIEQDVRDLEEDVMERPVPSKELSEKLLVIADKLNDLQNG